MLQEIDVEVDGAVKGGQQVAGAGHVGQPARPLQLRLKMLKLLQDVIIRDFLMFNIFLIFLNRS